MKGGLFRHYNVINGMTLILPRGKNVDLRQEIDGCLIGISVEMCSIALWNTVEVIRRISSRNWFENTFRLPAIHFCDFLRCSYCMRFVILIPLRRAVCRWRSLDWIGRGSRSLPRDARGIQFTELDLARDWTTRGRFFWWTWAKWPVVGSQSTHVG